MLKLVGMTTNAQKVDVCRAVIRLVGINMVSMEKTLIVGQ